MRILVTGATGFIGSSLCRSLADAGHAVRGASRSSVAANPGVAMVRVDGLGPATDWQAALRSIDVVIHAAGRAHVSPKPGESGDDYQAINAEGTRRLADQAVEAGVHHFIFLSSVLVYPSGAVLPLEPDTPTGPETAYGRSKLSAETYLEGIAGRSGMGVTVLRLPLTYGPGVGGNLGLLMRLVRTGLPLPLGGIDNRRSLLGVANLADLVQTLLDRPDGYRRFLPSDGDAVSTTQIVRALAEGFGRDPLLFPVPQWLLRAGAAAVGRSRMAQQLTGDLTVRDENLERVGWSAVEGTIDGLRRAAMQSSG